MTNWQGKVARISDLTSGIVACALLAAHAGGPAPLSAQTATPAAGPRITASTRTRALQPGEVVVVIVRTTAAVQHLSGHTPAGPVHLFRTPDPSVWQALVGLDVKIKAGPFPVTVRAAASGNASSEITNTLRVLPKRFPDRRITVDERFLRPPAGELARIEREARLLASVLSGTSAERAWRGAFVAPVPGGPTSAFGRVSVVNGERRAPHGGIDLQAAEGTPVRAPNAGRVVLSEALYYAGDTIIIDHGLGVFSLLAHLSIRQKQEGEVVGPGEVVGLSGATGRITGPHLHWAVRIGGAVVDPTSLMYLADVLSR